jgi:hypothetical protein
MGDNCFAVALTPVSCSADESAEWAADGRARSFRRVGQEQPLARLAQKFGQRLWPQVPQSRMLPNILYRRECCSIPAGTLRKFNNLGLIIEE